MASDLVNAATSDKLPEVDWAKNIEICELVARDQRQAKSVVKAIKKRLGSKSSNAQLYAVMLLEMLMNNIGEAVHTQIIEAGLLSILVKIVKKKSDSPVRERIFLLLDATQTSLGGASGKFPQYYNAYYELVSAGVKFQQRPHAVPRDHPPSGASQNTLTVAQIASANGEQTTRQEESQQSQPSPGSGIIEKARAALDVLREVLDAVDTQNPQAAKDEFTLDLVEQCSFQKDRVMHLVMSSRDERLVSQAIELNEQLGKVLARHEALLSDKPASTLSPIERHDEPPPTSDHINHVGRGTWASKHNNSAGQPTTRSNSISLTDFEEAEEEEAEQLSHRIRKGKAHMRHEDEDSGEERSLGFSPSSIPSERLNRPLIRPLTLDPPSPEIRAPSPPLATSIPPSEIRATPPPPATSIPPPPAKHVEREKFFQEKRGDGAGLSGHMRGLSLHSRNASSSSYTGSMSSSE